MSYRVAFIHNTVVAQRVAFFSPGQTAADVGAYGIDFIIAANYLQGGMLVGRSGVESALRVQSNHRTIIVDNRARCGFDMQGTKYTYRSHFGNQDFYMCLNMNEYGDGILFMPKNVQPTSRPNYCMVDHWEYDYLNHYNGPGTVHVANSQRSSDGWPGALVVVNNRAFRSVQKNPAGVEDYRGRWRWYLKAGDTSSNNIVYPYHTPPALNERLAADGVLPGADH